MNIKKVSEIIGLSVDTIRYYERVGVVPPVARDHNGYRDYHINDINWLFLAKSLKTAGLSIESLIEFSNLAQSEDNVTAAQKSLLHEQLDEINVKLDTVRRTKALLEYKIKTFDEHLAKFDSGEMTPDNTEKLWENRHFIDDKHQSH
ncbi:MerR family transcriptional regulator [Lactiplantibacillus paraplantarum]|uniref:MerR family transcriptional regulator n=1 Tax=Lactiplantibacillus paraplantarum TaxID=60520 RepID=UPI0021A33A40|nr:MerR family transcriptional regulator [Lactiplantibacillus paraplantarum]MCT4457759.1 MerR family transcriptional regulator [Lactiplantibacillus paraplantarum]